MLFIHDLFFPVKKDVGTVRSQPAEDRVSEAREVHDVTLTGETCQRQVETNSSSVNSRCCFFFFLPSFAGMHRAPSNARLQTHVHATSRKPQLHQRDCMAHPEKKQQHTTSYREGGVGGLFLLNNSSFGHREAGYRIESICIVTRPL